MAGSRVFLPDFPAGSCWLSNDLCNVFVRRAVFHQDAYAYVRTFSLVFSGNCPFEKKTVQAYNSLRAVFDSLGVQVVTVDGIRGNSSTARKGPSCDRREARCVRKVLGVPKRRAALVVIEGPRLTVRFALDHLPSPTQLLDAITH